MDGEYGDRRVPSDGRDMTTTWTWRDTTSLRAHRWSAGAAFFVQGLLFISLTTRLPQIQETWGLSELAVSGLLLMVVLLAGGGSVLAEVLAGRNPSARLVRVGLLVATAGLGVLMLAPTFPVFVVGLATYGVSLGLIDASTNMQAVSVEYLYLRPILPSFHGFWTAGGILATLVSIALAGVALGPALLPLLLVPLVALAAPYLRHDHTIDTSEPVPISWRPLLVLGAAMVLFYMVDTASTTWGPVFLNTTFDAPERVLPLATLPYLVATLVARVAGDGFVARFGPVVVLRVGGILASLALLVVVTSVGWPMAVAGFTLVGAAVAVIAPLSFSAAAAVAGGGDWSDRQERVDRVIARFNQFNYVGALLGAVLTGAVGAESLRIGFAVPMVLILAIVPLAGAFGVIRRTLPRDEVGHP